MTTPDATAEPVGLYVDVHPVDLVERAKNKLHLFNILMVNDGGQISLDVPEIANGLYFFLQGITNELDLAVCQLNQYTFTRSTEPKGD